MIDAHAHLTFNLFDEDRKEVIKRAKEGGVEKIITVGTQISSSSDALTLSKQYDFIYASVGIHPHHADKLEDNWLQNLESLAKHEKVVSIGECGLDKYHYHSNGVVDMNIQMEVFESQIHLSKKLGLPLQIHNRLAWDEVEQVLISNKNNLNNPPGLLHCFSGTHDYLKKMLDLGFYIGFDGNITYPNLAKGEKVHLTDLLKSTPVDRIITESDCPFLTPIPLRGQRNEPKNVIIVSQFIADQKNISLEVLTSTVAKNTRQLFNI